MKVPLSRPDIGDAEIGLVTEVLRSGHLALGPRGREFENVLARFAGRRFGIAVNSGTSGLHLLVRAYGIGEGDEVITTPFSFVASSNAILYEGATPVFVDVDSRTGNIDPERLEAAVTDRTRAILPVDVFGHPARLDEIRGVARRHGLVVIEDACEALGAEWKGVRAGHGDWCDAAVFAFYPNKQITTGEGGMIVTDDPKIATLCRSMRNQGRSPPSASEGDSGDELDGLWLRHERLGYNYRLDELSAALGVVQMRRLDELLAARARVADLYMDRLGDAEGVRLPAVEPEVTRMSWFVFVVRVGGGQEDPARQTATRDSVMRMLTRAGVQCRPYFTPIHLQPFYRECFGFREGDFPVAERLGRISVAIPFYAGITEDEVNYVAGVLEEAVADEMARTRGS